MAAGWETANFKKTWTFEQLEPASVAGLTYVTFPSPDQTVDGYAVMALHKSTTVKVPHVMAQDPTSGLVFLQNEGDEVRLNLTSPGSFHVILADKPVQVARVAAGLPVNGSSGAAPDLCCASLLSERAWSNNYSWTLPSRLAGRTTGLSVHLYVIMRYPLTHSFRLDGRGVNVDWQNLTSPSYASDLSCACLEIDSQYHWVDLNQSAGNFSAYLLIVGPGLRICTSLGHVATKADSSIDWTLDGLQEIKYGFDEHTTTAEPQTTAYVNDYVTSVASSDTTLSAGTTSAILTVTTSANSTADCYVCWAPSNSTFNLTTEELNSILEAIRAQLQVNQKVTSAYRRSLECSPDYRPVSNGIGVAGILVCTFVMLFIVASDLSALRHLCDKSRTRSVT
ncbi:hypothetical protein Btru_075698 [Bulinus truncatus]|nr:hypothetical protein Btru_075698 [Bulinus truncatus]